MRCMYQYTANRNVFRCLQIVSLPGNGKEGKGEKGGEMREGRRGEGVPYPIQALSVSEKDG